MRHGRVALLLASGALVLVLLGGGLGLKVGAADSSGEVIHFAEVLALVRDNYVDSVGTEELLQGAYEGLLTGLDSQGGYLTPEEAREWKSRDSSSAAGAGVSVLKAYGALEIVRVDPGSPAEEAGILPGDQIRTIEGRSLRALSLRQATALLRGRSGSEVTFVLLRPREEFKREELTLQRRERSVRPYELTVDGSAAVLVVRDLVRLDTGALADELDDVRSRGIDSLLLDLRNVVEEDARSASALSGLFLNGALLSLRDRSGKQLAEVTADGPGDAWAGRLAVLVNRATAGAGEAVTRLLQTERDATVFGESTYGLGTEPRLFELPDGGGLLLSAARWETVAGEGWSGEGVRPDREILSETRGFEYEQALDDQLRRTLDALAETEPAAAREAA